MVSGLLPCSSAIISVLRSAQIIGSFFEQHAKKRPHLQVFATVGTDAKRTFLADGYNIPNNRIFSSRSTDFAIQLMEATDGRGVDVILNSLTRDMLHESWRCIAENGTFIEIGKRDLVDRNSLSMEPFNRNASYRAVDMSRKSMPAEVIFRLVTRFCIAPHPSFMSLTQSSKSRHIPSGQDQPWASETTAYLQGLPVPRDC